MQKDEFLRDPLRHATGAIPVDWLRAGWSESRFRVDVTYLLARSLSKTGGFDLVSEHWLTALSAALTLEEATDLYVCLCDESQRLEFEWRESFIRLFPQASDQLPPSNDAAILLETLEYIVNSGDGTNLAEVLSLIVAMPQLSIQLPMLAQKARANGHDLIADLILEAHKS